MMICIILNDDEELNKPPGASSTFSVFEAEAGGKEGYEAIKNMPCMAMTVRLASAEILATFFLKNMTTSRRPTHTPASAHPLQRYSSHLIPLPSKTP